MCAMIYHFLCSSLFLAPSIILEVCNVSPYIQIVQAYSLCFYIHIKTHLLCYILFCSCTTYILLKNKFLKELVGGFFLCWLITFVNWVWIVFLIVNIEMVKFNFLKKKHYWGFHRFYIQSNLINFTERNLRDIWGSMLFK